MGFGKFEEFDVKNLRLFFVKEFNENINEYKEWMFSILVIVDIECFKKDGFFVSEIGDFCVKVCVNIFCILIVFIIVLLIVFFILFLLKVFVIIIFIYLVYDYLGLGYYDVIKGEKIFIRSSFYDNSYYYCVICYKFVNLVYGVNYLLGEISDIKVV